MPRQSNSLEWYKKAELDYFSAFTKLWLSFNSLYKRIFQNSGFGRRDRLYIEEIKNANNIIKRRFRTLFDGISDESKEFKLHLYKLIKKYDGGLFGGTTIVCNTYVQAYMNNSQLSEIDFKEFIHLKSNQLQRKPPGYIKVGNMMSIRDNADEIFPYYIEIIYMLRNSLIHGEMEPTEENHQLIKNCYNSLNILIKDEV